MSQQQSGSGQGGMTRPDVMDQLSTTQLAELEDQFDDQDRASFDRITKSFGWDTDRTEKVWQWLAAGKKSQSQDNGSGVFTS